MPKRSKWIVTAAGDLDTIKKQLTDAGFVIDRALHEIGVITGRLDEQIPFMLKADAATAIRMSLEVAFIYFESNEKLFTELANNWQATGRSDFVDAFEGYMLDAMRMFMAQNYAAYEPLDLNTLSFIMSNATMFVLSRFVSRKPKGVTKEALIAHVTELYSLYFKSKERK